MGQIQPNLAQIILDLIYTESHADQKLLKLNVNSVNQTFMTTWSLAKIYNIPIRKLRYSDFTI